MRDFFPGPLHSNLSRTLSPAGRRRLPSGFASRPHRRVPSPLHLPAAISSCAGRARRRMSKWLTRCSSVPCAPTCSSIPPASPAAAQRYQGRPQPQGQQVPSPAHRRKHLSPRSQSNPSLIRGNERNSFGLGCCAEYADGNLQWQPSQAIISRCEVLKRKIGNLLKIIGSLINLLLFDHRLAGLWS